MATTTIISRPNPYVGPRPYKQGEIIYGRERETSELLDLLIAERIVLLYSPSGAGKSSLLNAAILPQMAEQGFEVLPSMRINQEPPLNADLDPDFNRYVYSCLLSMEEALPEDKRFSANDLATLKFKDYITRYQERALSLNPDYSYPSLLLMFDQAEEVIRVSMTDREKKVDFFLQVGEVLRDRNIWALFAIREDYLASFDSYVRPIPTRLATRYRLNFLSAEAAMQAIQRPSVKAGIEFPDDCASDLTDDLRKVLVQQPDGATVEELGPYVEPVQLQVVCRRLWSELPEGTSSVTSEHIKALGSVNRALGDYYSLQVASVAATSKVPEREIREWFDRKLITVSGIRGQVLMTTGESDGLENKAIWMLERTYLVRAEKRGGATWFELAHDRLVRPIRENNGDWFEKNLSALQRQADVWNTQGRSDGMLIIGQDFLEMQKWVKENHSTMTQVEKEFYAASKKAHENDLRERRNNLLIRWLFIASLVALVVAVAGVIYALYQQRIAIVREHVAAANEVVTQDPQLAALIALKAIDEAKITPAELQFKSQEALHHALIGMRVERVFTGHTDRVYQAFFDKEAKRFVSVSADKTAIIWDYKSGAAILTLSNPNLEINAAIFSPDGKRVATGDNKGIVTVWDADNGTIIKEFPAHEGPVNWLDFDKDGVHFATAGADGKVILWDANTYANLHTIHVQPDGLPINVSVVRFSPDGKKLASGDDDGFARIWDVGTGEKLDEIKHNPDEPVRVLGLSFSPDGKRLATTGSDFAIVESSAVNGARISRLEGHSDWVYTVVFTNEPNVKQQRLISVSADRTLRVWDVNTGKPLLVVSGFVNQLYHVDLHPDQQHVLVSSADKSIYDINISPQGSRDLLAITDIPAEAETIDYSPDGSRIATAGDVSLHFFDTHTGKLTLTTEPQDENLVSVDFSPDGKWVVAAGDYSAAYVFDTATGKVKTTFDDYESPDANANWATFAPDSKRVAVAGSDGRLYVFDSSTGKTIYSVPGSDVEGATNVQVSTAEFTPNGKFLAAGINENDSDNDSSKVRHYIRIWDAATGQPVKTIEDRAVVTEYIWKIAISPDSSLMTVGFDESTGIVPIWNIAPGKDQWQKVKELKGNKGIVYTLDFSPDGKQLLTGSADKTLRLWDVENGTTEMTLYGVTQLVNSARFSPDGTQVADVGDIPAVIRIYELRPDALVELAYKRLTRWWREDECRQYLQSDTCPPRPAGFIGQ
jgi:WD40 repeat protein